MPVPTDEPTPVSDRPPPPPEWLSPGVLVPAYVLLVVAGYFVFARGWGTHGAGAEMSRPQALMVAINAATLTGFQQARNPADYTPLGQAVTLVLMLGGSLFSLIVGGLAVTRIARLAYRDATVARAAVAWVAGSALVGGAALLARGRPPFAAVYQAVSAFGNGGLFLGVLPRPTELRSTLVLLPLAVLGGLGVPVLLDLARGRASAHTRRVVIGSALVYLVTVGLMVPMLAWHDTSQETWHETASAVSSAVATASWQACNARSAGFGFGYVAELAAPAAAVVLLLPMLVGGAPGGTAGGLKVTTPLALFAGVADAVRGRPVPRAFGVAVGWVAVYVTVLLAAWVGLILADPEQRADRLLFLATSALGNVGLSYDSVAVSTPGYFLLAATMLIGRLLPVALLWTIADRLPDVDVPVG